MKKISIVGCGRIFNKHYNSINNLKDYFVISGVFDLDKKKNQLASKKTSTKQFKSLDEMINSSKPDIIVILVESGNHLKICKKIVLKHKIKNFIIEKPLDVSVEKIKKFKKFINGKNINIFTVKQNRFNKAIVKAKRIINQDLIGGIFMISASCKWKRDQQYYNLDNWRGTKKLDGGVLMNQAIHHIDLLVHLVGDIKSVMGYGNKKFVKMESENIAVAVLKFKSGCLGVVEATTASSPEDFEGSITIMGSKGTMKIGGFASNKLEFFKNKSNTKIDLNKYSNQIENVYGHGHLEFYRFIKFFLKNKNRNKKNPFDINSSIKSVQVVESIYSSFKTKKEKKIE